MTYTIDDFKQAKTGEAPVNQKPKKQACFQGAWYFKALSERAMWLGIEATIRFPEFVPDENRKETITQNGKTITRYLDTPSVYFGGSADDETDIGFGYFRGLRDGEISDEKFTFRPFWRTIYHENGKEVNRYLGTPIENTAHYYYPGDKVKVRLVSEKEDELSFSVELIEKTTILRYAEYRKAIGETTDLLVRGIKAPGNQIATSEYKFVHAIDQYHNEGKPTQMTNAYTKGCRFWDIALFFEQNGMLKKEQNTDDLFVHMTCPDADAFTIKPTDRGMEVNIHPADKHIQGR